MPQEPARKVGPYEIVRQIDRGGMALVFLARQENLDRSVALKLLNALPADDPELAARFVQEARVASSLTDPNIVTTYEYFVHDGRAYIAMEYLRNGSLRKHVRSLSLPQIGGVLESTLAALAHAHSHGIVHRDLKPENVLVTDRGVCKLADFGIAKALNSVGTLGFRTRTGHTVGTPSYMAPEQALAGEVSVRTDLYSVGVMAYEMVTRQLPYGREDHYTPMQIMLGHIQGECPRPGVIAPSLDPRLGAWIERMMSRDPANRPESAAEAFEELEEVIVELEGPLWRRRSTLEVTVGEPSGFVTFDGAAAGPASPPAIEPSSSILPVPPPLDVEREPEIAPPVFVPATASAFVPAPPPPPPVQPAPAPSDPVYWAPTAVPQAQQLPAQAVHTPAAPLPLAAEPKPKRRRRGRLIGAGVVGVAGIGAAAVVGSSLAFGSEPKPPLNVRPAEAAVKAKVAEQTPVTSVRCPRGLPALSSIKFACTVTLTGSDQPLLAIVEHRGGKDIVSLRLR